MRLMERGDSQEGIIDLKEAVSFLQETLLEAGEILKRHFKDRKFFTKQKKGVDFTTEADTEVDKFLRDKIASKYPSHQFLTEETAPSDYSSLEFVENLWVIDPLDGTINFSRGVGHFAISVGLMQKGEVVLGVIYVPLADKLYFARQGKDGANLNGQPIRVSATEDLREVVLGCDWAWDLKKRVNIVDWLGKVSGHVRRIASQGSGVADLASLAEGKMDVYFHSGIKPWDVAAAGFIIQKAGGRVTDIDGSDWSPFKKEILATNGRLHAKILSLLGPSPVKY